MKRLLPGIAAVIVLLQPLSAQQVTDAEALSLLLREAAREAAMRVTHSSVLLDVRPIEAPPVVTQVFAEEQLARGRSVRTDGARADEVLTVDVRDMHSVTAPGENSSYFRETHATLGLMLRSGSDASITWSEERTLSRTDTLDGVAPYEQRSWLASGTSWWDAVLAPALVTLTAGVIVLLLFTVRGSS
jgi:hypothetical protein